MGRWHVPLQRRLWLAPAAVVSRPPDVVNHLGQNSFHTRKTTAETQSACHTLHVALQLAGYFVPQPQWVTPAQQGLPIDISRLFVVNRLGHTTSLHTL
jgi:hypothetical protein